MAKPACRAVLMLLLVTCCGRAAVAGDPAGQESADSEFRPLHALITYLPNRVLDGLDIVRARVRLGPGMALGARATEAADFFLGSYLSVFAGLPGPRGRKLPRLPVGIENRTGAELGLADASLGAGFGPDYSASEFGAGLHVAIAGAEVGFDPFELIDFVAGFLFVDAADDDW